MVETNVSETPMEEFEDEESAKELKQLDEAKFESYLRSLLKVVSGTTQESTTVDVISKQSTTPTSSQTIDANKCIPMKPKDFFTQNATIYTSAIQTVSQSIIHNENITEPCKSFLGECLRYVKYRSQETLLFLKPIDFLFTFKDNNKLTKLTVILYCVYDLLYTTGTALKLRKIHVRHIQEMLIPKEKKTKVKRPRYLAIVYNGELTFTSKIVCEFLLQMIESGVLRCSSLTKAFLLTKDTIAFYKYCLISKKVCLKRIVEPQSVRI